MIELFTVFAANGHRVSTAYEASTCHAVHVMEDGVAARSARAAQSMPLS